MGIRVRIRETYYRLYAQHEKDAHSKWDSQLSEGSIGCLSMGILVRIRETYYRLHAQHKKEADS